MLFSGTMTMQPRGVLIDYGGTLVEEVSFDVRAGNVWLLEQASHRPSHVTLEEVLDRTTKVATEIVARREEFQVETPWPMLTRLVHDFFGIRFEDSMPDLELGF